MKTSSKSLFDAYMDRFRPELETCPVCGSRGCCSIHAYYDRSITDFTDGHRERSSLCVMRVICESCSSTHAILPDIIIPYSGYGLLFILRVLGEYFAGLSTIAQLCDAYGISAKQFYKWLALWKAHKREWLDLLNDSETSDHSFWLELSSMDSYSGFSMGFIRKTARSFLQSHKNPVPAHCKNARYCQRVFAPDISIV